MTGNEPLIAAVSLPDPNDRHVVAVAVRAGALMLPHVRHARGCIAGP